MVMAEGEGAVGIVIDEVEEAVLLLTDIFLEQHRRQHRHQRQREQQSAEQGKAEGVGQG